MAPGLLATDGYKFSMAEAGFPLRPETFYYSHRCGGPHILPFDVETTVRALLPTVCDTDYATLSGYGYGMGGAFRHALESGQVTLRALPKGSWFFDREPVFTVTGPSALVSWLEPLVLQLHYRIQVATLAVLSTPEELAAAVGTVTCTRQRELVLETLEAVGVRAPSIVVDSPSYRAHVRDRVRGLIDCVGDPLRLFEVGLRAATCPEQHTIALQACQEVGVVSTSHVQAAQDLGMRAVGTMGHEHVQRHGSDAAAFRAMRDRHPGPTSFLLDTWSTLHSGLPTAYALIAEDPSRHDTVRFDSGDKETQFLIANSMAKAAGVRPRFILEDGFTAAMTTRFEELRAFAGLPPEDVLYGYGGYIVKAPGDPLTRDRVAAVYKLTQSGPQPTMKFGDEPGAGKESVPGEPVLWRRYARNRWSGVIGQLGEDSAEDLCLTGLGADDTLRVQFTPSEAMAFAAAQGEGPALSPETRDLVHALTQARQAQLIRR